MAIRRVKIEGDSQSSRQRSYRSESGRKQTCFHCDEPTNHYEIIDIKTGERSSIEDGGRYLCQSCAVRLQNKLRDDTRGNPAFERAIAEVMKNPKEDLQW